MLAGTLVVWEESFKLRAVPAVECAEPCGELLTGRSLGRLHSCPARLHNIEETTGDAQSSDRILDGSLLLAELMLVKTFRGPGDHIAALTRGAWNEIICGTRCVLRRQCPGRS